MSSPLDKTLISTTEALKKGRMVCVFDDTSNTPAGYLLLPGKSADKNQLSFMINEGRGIILCVMQEETARSLGLSPLGDISKEAFPLSIGVEARSGISTGISASDRAASIQAIAAWDRKSKNIIAPGHIFPLIGKKGGLLVKSSIAEACLDLLEIAGEKETGAISHLLSPDGELMTEDEVFSFSGSKNIPCIKISGIIQHRLSKEPLVSKVATARLPTGEFGDFVAHCYISHHDKAEHLVLAKNLDPDRKGNQVLVRMHSERKFGDLFLETGEHSKDKLNLALRAINEHGSGALVYIRKHKTGFLSRQIKKMVADDIKGEQRESEKITELRELGIGAQMLLDLDIRKLRLLTSSTKPFIDLSVFNLHIIEQVLLKGIR
jgi:3,4-dihydroxy 2-butanone 4-phosphate synthase/GTP cyclohydrolase II